MLPFICNDPLSGTNYIENPNPYMVRFPFIHAYVPLNNTQEDPRVSNLIFLRCNVDFKRVPPSSVSGLGVEICQCFSVSDSESILDSQFTNSTTTTLTTLASLYSKYTELDLLSSRNPTPIWVRKPKDGCHGLTNNFVR